VREAGDTELVRLCAVLRMTDAAAAAAAAVATLAIVPRRRTMTHDVRHRHAPS